MIKKTCVKQAYKYWPKTERLETAIHHLNTEGGEGLTDINEKPNALDAAPLIAAALQTATDAEALAFWREHNASLIGDPAAHKRLKDAIAGHRARMAEVLKQPEVIEQKMPEVSDEDKDLQRGAQ